MVYFYLIKNKCLFKLLICCFSFVSFCQSTFEEYQELLLRDSKKEQKSEITNTNALVLSVGRFNVQRSGVNYVDLAFHLQSCSMFRVTPCCGVLVSESKAYYIYTSIQTVLPFGISRFALIPSLSAGYYNRGSGIDLGFPLEFRSCVTLHFKTNLCALGICLSHISNAHLGRVNPGLETVGLSIQF